MTTPTTVNVRLQLRADTAANWTAANPTLLANEVGLETDTKKLKVGNGSSAWNSLTYFPSIVSGGTVLGNLEIGSTGTLTFEGSTADGFETTLAVTNPTADRTITLPNQSGTVIVSGNASIVNADIAANAEIAVSKLANGTANQVIVTDGTNVSWSDDLTLAGNLTVNGTTTTINTQDLLVEDKNIIIGNVATPTDVTADGGGITLKGATDKTINWVDSTDAWTSSERFSVPLGSAASPSLTFTGDENTGIYSPGADQLAISTNGTGRLFVDANGKISANLTTANLVSSLGVAGVDTNNSLASSAAGISIVNTNSSAFNRTGVLTFGQGAYGDVQALASVAGVYTNYTTSVGGALVFSTNNGSGGFGERLRITSGGNVGIGTTSPVEALHVEKNYDGATVIRVSNSDAGSAAGSYLQLRTGSKYTNFQTYGAGNLCLIAGGGGINTFYSDFDSHIWRNNGGTSEHARIDSSGRLLVGTSSSRSLATASAGTLQVEGTTAQVVSLASNVNDVASSYLVFGKSRGTSLGAVTSVSAGDDLGGIYFAGADGTSTVYGGAIVAQVDGTPGANDMPGRLVFSTTKDGQASPTEALRIDSQQRVGIGKTPDSSSSNGVEFWSSGVEILARSSGTCLYVNRNTSDGTIVEIQQDAVQEGSISVSGTTVSYNGAHLSRWSQLPSGAERTEILRGTVLSSIDEMCEWGDEENEQLNRMKVSDVEGDKNVSGVFQAWDDDDDTYTNDFYCAMTGDFIIRIAAGVTVERGDLLMSAGDGTAKPQDDDIIRSKTVAKVTSTNVSCTYPDGSYCVPCVLMAC